MKQKFVFTLALMACGCLSPTPQEAIDNGKPEVLQKQIQATPAISQNTELVAGVLKGDQVELLRVFLDSGTDPNSGGRNTLLGLAAEANAHKCTALLIERGARLESSPSARTPLMEAAGSGSVDSLRVLLKSGARVDQVSSTKDTALHLACQAGSVECVELLIEAGADPQAKALAGTSPLDYAIKGGSQKVVEYLLGMGAEVSGDELYYCVVENQVPLLQFLLGQETDKRLDRALRAAVTFDRKEAVDILLANGANVDAPVYGGTPIRAAVESGREQMALYLLKRGADPNQDGLYVESVLANMDSLSGKIEELAKPSTLSGGRVIQLLRSKDWSELDALLAENPSLVTESMAGQSALDRAVTLGVPKGVDILLKHGAKIEYDTLTLAVTQNESGEILALLLKGAPTLTPPNEYITSLLAEASRPGKADMLKMLLEAGAPKDESALIWASRGPNSRPVEILLKAGISPNYQDNSGQSALHAAATGSPAITQLLLQAGAHAEIVDKNGLTPLYYVGASYRDGEKEIIKNMLMEAGAPPEDLDFLELVRSCCVLGADLKLNSELVNRKDPSGDTPLQLALNCENLEVVEQLLKAGANPQVALPDVVYAKKVALMELLFEAGAKGDMKSLCHLSYNPPFDPFIGERLLEDGLDLHSKNEEGSHPLIYAAYDNPVMAEWFLEKGCDPNVANRSDTRPLHRASVAGQHSTVKRLLEAGASVGAQDDQGNLPLHRACFNGHLRSAELLISAGSATKVKNKKGETPLSLAEKSGRKPLIDLLKSSK